MERREHKEFQALAIFDALMDQVLEEHPLSTDYTVNPWYWAYAEIDQVRQLVDNSETDDHESVITQRLDPRLQTEIFDALREAANTPDKADLEDFTPGQQVSLHPLNQGQWPHPVGTVTLVGTRYVHVDTGRAKPDKILPRYLVPHSTANEE